LARNISKVDRGKKDGSFERQLKRLEEIVDALEQGEVPLDEAVKMYEEGLQISKLCLQKLNQAELKLKRLSKDVDGNFELFDETLEE
jgi:exodeoxyribonuclease VII small subunit